MKTKISKYIISILFILIFIRISYLFLRNKIENKYELKYNDYLIKVEEKYEKSKTDNLDAYNYKILVDNAEYNFQIFDNLYKQEKNIKKDTLSDEMMMFIVLNTASLQLIPTNVIAIRTALNSNNATQIIFPVWGATIIAAIIGIIATKLIIKKVKY